MPERGLHHRGGQGCGMDDLLGRTWNQLAERIGGPLGFRFILQPTVATFLAVRAGVRDASQGRSAFLWTALVDSTERRELLSTGWQQIGRLFVFAFLLDAVYQMFVLRWFYPLQALLVAWALAVMPYVIVRGPVNRVVRARRCR
jgi:hypothetical protein